MAETLTASSMACALRCPRKYYYAHIIGLTPTHPSEALQIGTAVHNATEARANGGDFDAQYRAAIDGVSLDTYTAAKLFGIIAAYDQTYGEIDDVDYQSMQPEVEFSVRISGSRSFVQRGKIDGLATLKDGWRVLWERKTTSEDIAESGNYWARLKFNIQILAYYEWAQVMMDNTYTLTCCYDVIRKPALTPRASVTDVDSDGVPIVLAADGSRALKRDGTPKRTADNTKGERLSTHAETADEYGERVRRAMTEDKDRYFARRFFEPTAEALNEFRRERLNVCKMLLHFKRESSKEKYREFGYPRSCTPDNCAFCQFAGFCLERLHVDENNVPQGFEIRHNPELSFV